MKFSLQSIFSSERHGPFQYSRYLLGIAATFSFFNLIFLLVWYHPDAIPMGATGGVWTALAYDFSKGIFYRPVFDDFGYGGTRYLFLFFTLHGILIRIFNDPVLTGFSLVLVSAVSLNLGIYFLFRQLKLQVFLSTAFSILTTVCITYQLLTLEIMGEFLSCALNVFGIVFALKLLKKDSSLFLILSALGFAGSFLTKFSSLMGLTAVCIYLWMHQRSRTMFQLITGTGCLILGALWVSYEVSDGRILSSFMSFGQGPVHWDYFFKFPLWFLMQLGRDPFFLLLFGFTLYFVFRDQTPLRESFPKFYFFIVLGFTLFILTSPGTDYNHMLDLIVACILVLGIQFHKHACSPRIWNSLFLLLTAGLIFTWLPGTISIKKFMQAGGGKPTRHTVERVIAGLGKDPEYILSENPLVPILMNQRPVLLDAFALRRLSLTRPEILRDFSQKMENKIFQSVILMDFSGVPESEIQSAMENHFVLGAKKFYGGVHFPPDFLTLLKENYSLGFMEKPFVVFFPKSSSSE